MPAQVALGPAPITTFLDNNGAPLAGGKIYTYQAGTLIAQATYTDSTGGTQNANPVILDAAGRAQIWFTSLAYKIAVNDLNDVNIYTVDGFSIGVFASANNSFSGNNSFAGTTTFNGALDATAGGALAGTFSGNPTFSGSPSFSGTIVANVFQSTVATGTPPLIVASTTVVPNLNVEIVNGVAFPTGGAVGTVPQISSPNVITYAAFGSADVQIFTTPGANTWTKPSNAKMTTVLMVGGGGGGGGTDSITKGGGGGGGAGVSSQSFASSILGATETVTVGAGGSGGQITNGGDGTASSFGSWLEATLGTGGKAASPYTGGSGGSGNLGNGGAGGAGGSGAGVNGVQGTFFGAGGGGGGGWNTGDGGAGGNGGPLHGSTLTGGAAGTGTSAGDGGAGTRPVVNEVFGGPGGGGGGGNNSTGSGGNGGAPLRYGGGGGGTGSGSGASSGTAGNGAPGIVIVTTYS